MLKLRPYQLECLEAIKKHREEGRNRQLVSMATGAGKTVVFAHLLANTAGRGLVLAHTNEILEQSKEKIQMVNPSAKVGIVNAESKEFGADIVIASVQSAIRPDTLDMLRRASFELCIVDEAHHSATDSQRFLLESLGFGSNTSGLLVGFTATPFRSDSKGLGEVFDVIAYSKTTAELIKEGYLVKPEGIKVATDLDLSNIPLSNGDYGAASLAQVMDTPELVATVVEAYVKSGMKAPTICFCVTVQHAHHIAQAFNKAGIASAVVSGDMSWQDRHNVLQDYREGRTQVLCNCQVLTEGFDAPETACIIVARPTRSRLLYQQVVGRGLRLWPNKRSCLVLDFCDRAHSLCNAADFLSFDSDSKKEGEERSEFGATPVISTLPSKLNKNLQAALLSFDPLSDTFTWKREATAYVLTAGAAGKLIVRPTAKGLYDAVFDKDGRVIPIATRCSFEYAFAAAEDYARANRSTFVVSDRDAPWRKLPISANQVNLFRKNGYRTDINKLTRGQAADLIASGALKKKT